ncbi:DNA replication/repair protein RecF [Alkalicella caledoniensis]|uniref:DNA replication and repair protein RecF n=1 Tax=Alkalicella caledoniensis TaxID=2731377 RepID=A0A7G9W8I4_ALKCA|nr:DNA replication/repair protein RecF [Alkalicella caledoniensis]QNO14996.1 DNA replication/repair protein RecF [Alkalicella caledoniensis]
MYIKKIHVNNFRNYKNIDIEFKNDINIFLGNNAQGKTNLLEAIYFLSLGKSLRNYHKDDLIHWDKQYFYIKSIVNINDKDNTIEIGYNRNNRKVIKINGVEKRSFNDLLGFFNVVIFAPEDLLLVKGSPSLRRNFLDQEISQLVPYYSKLLSDYNKIVISRNKILKSNKADLIKTLDIFDEQLSNLASEIIKKRIDTLDKLKILASLTHRKLTDNQENLTIEYLSYLPERDIQKLSKQQIRESILLNYKENRKKDLEIRSTSIGPHRDDIQLNIDNKNVRKFGSQGQQRTTVLSLKLAELELFMSQKGIYPVLLLDDVLSELDEKRRNYLIKNIKDKIQTFITTTDKEDYLAGFGNIFNVNNGNIIF